jgi:hypothetical protein
VVGASKVVGPKIVGIPKVGSSVDD